MKNEHTGRVVITGGTRGIGFSLAQEFLERGFDVCICGTSRKSVDNALAILNGYEPKISGMPCNVAIRSDVEGLWNYAAEQMGGVDIWINNAGIGQKSIPAAEVEPEMVHTIINVNVTGVIHGSVCALKGMMVQGNGTILNMEGFGSNGMIRSGLSVYGTSKRAIRYFTRAFAEENKEQPIAIGTLSPGMVMTDFLLIPLASMDPGSASQAKKVFNILADTPDDVAGFLANKIVKNRKKNPHVDWLPAWKIILRFLTAPSRKNRLLDESENRT